VATEEKSELEPERQREILELDAKLADANHYEALGLSPGATSDEVRQAFRDLSRRFHPDRFFGKDLGPLRAKVDSIFRRLVEANQTLADPEKRAAYLEGNAALRAAVRAATGVPAPGPPRPKTDDEERRDRERRARLSKHPYLAKGARVQELLVAAKQAVGASDFSQAFAQLNQATQIDPQHAEARALLIGVRKKYEALRSDNDLKRAKEALDRGDEELALQALKAAVNANPGNAEAAFRAAQLLGQRGGGAREASAFASKAVEADPGNASYRLLLARLFEEAGMHAMAKKQLDEAAKLEPNSAALKKQVKGRWPF
jgi:curved DNA-binding protein CbpA